MKTIKNYIHVKKVSYSSEELPVYDPSTGEIISKVILSDIVDFEQVIIPAYPEIGRLKKTLSKLGAKFSSLSGSGSTVFGIFDEEADACSAQSYFQTQYKAILSTPVQN